MTGPQRALRTRFLCEAVTRGAPTVVGIGRTPRKRPISKRFDRALLRFNAGEAQGRLSDGRYQCIVEIDRRILIVDAPDGGLQQLSLDLMGRQFGVHYASDLDEAQLLARDVQGKILAVLFSTEIELGRIPDMARALGVETKTLIPVGKRPPKRVIAALAFHGVRWHLWDDPPNESLRFVLSSMLYDHDPFELRYHLRIPTQLAAQVEVEGQKLETSIRDIGLGGACLFGGMLGDIDARGDLLFDVNDKEIRLPVRVAWTSGDESPETNVTGVAFLEVEPEAGEAIDTLRRAFVERHRIQKPD